MPPKSKKAKKATKTPVLDKSKVEYFCGKCDGCGKEEEEVKKDADKSISCEKCAKWFHQPCTDLTPEDMEYMRKKAKASVVWLCIDCIESGSGERARMSNLEKTINNQSHGFKTKLLVVRTKISGYFFKLPQTATSM